MAERATSGTSFTMEDIAAMTPDQLREAFAALNVKHAELVTKNAELVTENEELTTRVARLENALETERARYAFLVHHHPLMQERLWLTRAFRTCSVQHSVVTGRVM